jgi:hypothetical protein
MGRISRGRRQNAYHAAGRRGRGRRSDGVAFPCSSTVVDGGSSSIAANHGIGLQYLLAASPDLRDGELLTVGQMYRPDGNGLLYRALRGQATLRPATDDVDDIINYLGNGISSADQVTENQLVFVPGAVPPVSVLPEPTSAPTDVLVTAPPETGPVAANEPVASSGLVWPVAGPISSYMGPDHPLGIDIDLFNNPFASVVAATSGTVTFAGGDPCCSYGSYVVVVSPDGIETLSARRHRRQCGPDGLAGAGAWQRGLHRLLHGQPPALRSDRQRRPRRPASVSAVSQTR